MILGEKRIFIVEDDHLNLLVITNLLRQHGAAVLMDLWGKATLNSLRAAMPIDVILMDLMLPHQISGYDVSAKIRAVPELASIPIIIVTAADPDVEMIKARKMGLNGFLSKPINQSLFPQCIAAVIDGQQVWGELV
jgi:CheY-like chemotaxis protein